MAKDNFRTILKNNRLIRSLVYRFRLYKDRHSYTFGQNNKVSIRGINVASLVQVSGNCNLILINSGTVLKKARLFIHGNHNKIIINQDSLLEGTYIHIEDNNCLIQIGTNTYVGPSHLACSEDGKTIIIGNECMLSSNIFVRTGDSHSIIDNNGNRINTAESILIDDHCWIGEGAKILKGVTLQKDTIVASGSIVTHSFPSNVILAGNPARIIKENVSWDKQRL